MTPGAVGNRLLRIAIVGPPKNDLRGELQLLYLSTSTANEELKPLAMDSDSDASIHNKIIELERREYDKVLRTLDYEDHHDLASHLLLAANYKKKQRMSGRTKRAKIAKEENQDEKSEDGVLIGDVWTAWPLPADVVPRPVPLHSTLSTEPDNLSSAVHAEIEAIILRTTRSALQAERKASSVSTNEHAPYQVTREVSSQVIAKLDRLLHA